MQKPLYPPILGTPCLKARVPNPKIVISCVPRMFEAVLLLLATVAMTEFASKSLPVKAHLKKNPEVEKLDGNR